MSSYSCVFYVTRALREPLFRTTQTKTGGHVMLPEAGVDMSRITMLRDRSALESLGEMAATIAHEVRNPLAGIRGAVQVIGARLPAGGREAQIVPQILARLDGLSDLMTA